MFPGLEVGKSVHFERGVVVRVLDGARISIGDRSYVQANCRLETDGALSIGADSFIGQGTIIVAAKRIAIGEDALIASHVVIRDQDHARSAKPYREQPVVSSPILIGRNVWIGTGAVILKGVTIGDDAVIGAGAVVTRDVESTTTVSGIPARVMRSP